jgi:5'-3' exonuclease
MHINDIKGLLNLLCVPYVTAKCEADFVCTALCKLGIVDAVISNDMDFIVLGCPIVIRNLIFKDDIVDVYYYDNILKNLNFNSNNLIELSLLLGCDYCNRIINIKNKYVYEIYKHFLSIDYMSYYLDDLNKYFVDNNILISDEIYNYIKYEKFTYNIDNINIEKMKSMLTVNISNNHELNLMINQTKDINNYDEGFNDISDTEISDTIGMTDININDLFLKCKYRLNDMYKDEHILNNVITYCTDKCFGLTKYLIIKKCHIICNKNINSRNKKINVYSSFEKKHKKHYYKHKTGYYHDLSNYRHSDKTFVY